jgi:hypothetical protein
VQISRASEDEDIQLYTYREFGGYDYDDHHGDESPDQPGSCSD